VSATSNALLGILGAVDEEIKKSNLEVPEGLSVSKLFKKTQLNALRGMALSSKKVSGGYLNTSFIDLGGANNGVFSIFKGKGGEWSAYEFAPSGSDLLFEFDINVDNIKDITLEMLEGVEDPIKAQWVDVMKKESVFKFISNGVHVRAAFVGRIGDTQNYQDTGTLEEEKMDYVVRIEGANKFLNIFQKVIDKFERIERKNGYTYYFFDSKDVVPYFSYEIKNTCIVVNESEDELLYGNNLDFIEECLGEGKKIKIFEEGSLEKKIPYTEDVDKVMSNLVFRSINEAILPELMAAKSGYVYTISLVKDGLLSKSLTPIPGEGQGLDMFSSNTYLAIIGTSAVVSPIAVREMARFRANSALKNGKKIYAGIRDYADNRNGQTPGLIEDSRNSNTLLGELLSSNSLIDKELFYVKGVSDFIEKTDLAKHMNKNVKLSNKENIFGYVAGLNLNKLSTKTPILITPFKKEEDQYSIDLEAFGNQIVIVYSDGSGAIYKVPENKIDKSKLDDTDGNLYKSEEVYDDAGKHFK